MYENKTFGVGDLETDVLDYLMVLLKSGKNYVYRGFSNSNIDLYPKILRDKKQRYVKDEWKFLQLFERYGSNYFHVNNAMDFLSCAQHFGLPTRLLDFTYNPFVALAFALYKGKENSEKKQKYRDYYFIRYCDLEDNLLIDEPMKYDYISGNADQGYISLSTQAKGLCEAIESHYNDKDLMFWTSKQSLDEYERDELIKKIKDRKLVFVDPYQSNQRLLMQQGLFMIPTTLDKSTYLSDVKHNTGIIKIHQSLRQKLLEHLDALGCDMYHLMPDLENVCKTIMQRYDDGRNNPKIDWVKEIEKSLHRINVQVAYPGELKKRGSLVTDSLSEISFV